MPDDKAELESTSFAPEEQPQQTTEEVEQPQEPEAQAVDLQAELIAQLTSERDALKDQLLRVMAEAQNIQRRMRQQRDAERKFASEGLVRDILPVLDNFERTLRAAEKSPSIEKLIDGVRAVEKQLRRALATAHVAKIEAVGVHFDPNKHEALAVGTTDEAEEDTVLEEISAGYTLHDKVIRPARVKVAKRP